MELLVAIAIIGILASLALGVMFSAQQAAREHHTRSLITKLHTQMMIRWESYRTRRLPLQPASNNVNVFAQEMLVARRELMRMELPDRYKDILFTPVAYIDGAVPIRPGLWFTYRQRLEEAINMRIDDPPTVPQENAILTIADDHQSAECLYMIMTTAMESDNTGRALFGENDVADIDGDGMKEFIDGWGNPIEWIRWPAGFVSDLQPVVMVLGVGVPTRDPDNNHDPFDPRRLDNDSQWLQFGEEPPAAADDVSEERSVSVSERGYRLFPLIMSAGRDQEYGVYFLHDDVFVPQDSDPYAFYFHDRRPLGDMSPDDRNYQRAEPIEAIFADFGGHLDNIDNHSLETR